MFLTIYFSSSVLSLFHPSFLSFSLAQVWVWLRSLRGLGCRQPDHTWRLLAVLLLLQGRHQRATVLPPVPAIHNQGVRVKATKQQPPNQRVTDKLDISATFFFLLQRFELTPRRPKRRWRALGKCSFSATEQSALTQVYETHRPVLYVCNCVVSVIQLTLQLSRVQKCDTRLIGAPNLTLRALNQSVS